jgi:urease alpha subunit
MTRVVRRDCDADARSHEPHDGNRRSALSLGSRRWNANAGAEVGRLSVKNTLLRSHPNASIPTPQPVWPRPMFAGAGRAAGDSSLAFVAEEAMTSGLSERLALARRLVPVESTRRLVKGDTTNNAALPSISVRPDSFAVTIDGEAVTEQPVAELPMAQRYLLF